MSWFDDLLSFGTSIYEAAKPVAQTVWDNGGKGALVGLAANAVTGGGGEKNLQAMGLGALGQNVWNAGTGQGWAGQMFGGGASAPTPSAGGIPGGIDASPQAGGPIDTMYKSVANVSPGVTSSSSAGNFMNYGSGSVGDGNLGEAAAREFMDKPASTYGDTYKGAARTASAVAPETGFTGAMNTARAGLNTAKQFGKDYGDVISTGVKAFGGLQAQSAGQKRIGDLNAMASRSEASDAANNAITSQRNAAAGDIYSEQRARIGSAGLQAKKGVDAGISRQLTDLNRNTTLSPTARAALAQKAKVAGSTAGASAYTQADTSARAGLRAPELQSFASPSNTARNAASYAQYQQDSAVSPYADVANDIFGLSKKKTEEEVGGTA